MRTIKTPNTDTRIPLDAQLMILLFEKTITFRLEISRFLCFCEIHTFQNI